MNPTAVASIVFACLFGGALFGMYLRTHLPEQHLGEASRDVIRLGMGLIATMSALVLGLVVATAKNSYDTQTDAIKETAVKILLLDHVLSAYGPDTQPTRDLMRQTVADRIQAIWPEHPSEPPQFGAPEEARMRSIEGRILELVPRTDIQRELRAQALDVVRGIAETRWLILGGQGSSVSLEFLVVVVFWLTLIFASFGLFAPRNATVVVVLLLCSVSVAGSIFLILEMDQPFTGLMKVSGAPLRYALDNLGQ